MIVSARLCLQACDKGMIEGKRKEKDQKILFSTVIVSSPFLRGQWTGKVGKVGLSES